MLHLSPPSQTLGFCTALTVDYNASRGHQEQKKKHEANRQMVQPVSPPLHEASLNAKSRKRKVLERERHS